MLQSDFTDKYILGWNIADFVEELLLFAPKIKKYEQKFQLFKIIFIPLHPSK